ncbi:MAG: hypothetical protein AUG44_25480 [Actinobacteria bacterium 13_1_20CM_3_71_11]|nr:MAG: hypothetical protein AUG44_25480 [Actinobacteria bacterium 13_1_20CM_3_71_11]
MSAARRAASSGDSTASRPADRPYPLSPSSAQASRSRCPPRSLSATARRVPFTATVDSQGRLTEVKLDFPAVDPQIPAVTSTYSDYGTTVTVTKPDAAQVQEAPDSLYQIFKK